MTRHAATFCKVTFFATLLTLTAGCDLFIHSHSVKEEAATESQIVCTEGPDCDVKWARAREWIRSNSKWNIAFQDHNKIVTAPSVGRSPSSSFLVMKKSLGQERYEIALFAGCDNFLRCTPHPKILKDRFNHFVLESDPDNDSL